jgi:hypothetical protein
MKKDRKGYAAIFPSGREKGTQLISPERNELRPLFGRQEPGNYFPGLPPGGLPFFLPPCGLPNRGPFTGANFRFVGP